jgi:REP element-mobilizing transposase RayT
VRLPAVVSVADVVRHIKGSSTHLITQEIAKDQFFKWQGAYAAFSVSIADLPRVSEYIAHQREHHAAGSLIAEWENLPDPEPQP